MKPGKIAGSLLAKTEMGKKIVGSPYHRMRFSAAVAFAFNLLYALYNGVLGIGSRSLWLTTMCAFYSILAVMRFFAVLCGRRNTSAVSAFFVMKLSGILLTVLGFILVAVLYISLAQNIAVKHGEIIMITIAAYTFYKIIMAIVRAVRQRKNPSLLLSVIRSIGYAEAAASVFTLQRSMLVSFGEMGREQIRLMNTLCGAGVCLFVFVLGVAMFVKGARKENKAE